MSKTHKSSTKSPIEFLFPCCSSMGKVTSRKSKQNERGRFHTCKECERIYSVKASGKSVTDIKNVG